MLTREIVDAPLGARFMVHQASDVIGFDQPGWVITDRKTGLMIWTGCDLTLMEAAERLQRSAATVIN